MHFQDKEQLRTIVESAPIGICILDATTFTAELVNEKFLEIAGKTKAEIIGKWYWEAFAEARVYYQEALNGVAETGKAFFADEVELMLIRHGREETIFVTFVYAPVLDEEGKVTKIAVWVLENTRQVIERRAVTTSEARLRALVTASSDVIYSLSADWEVMRQLDGRGFLKDTAEPISGWRAQNVHPDDMEIVNEKIAEAIKYKKIFELEHQVLRFDGSPGWTFSRAVPILDTRGEIVEWFGTASDITERKQMEAALRQASEELQATNEQLAVTNKEQAASNQELITTNSELASLNQQFGEARKKVEESEKHFRYLADLVPAKISNALPSGEVTFFNKQWLDYAGMSFEDLRDFGYHAMMHPEEIPVFQAQLAEAAAGGVPLESELRFKDINGNYRWHLNIVSPILNDQCEIIMWVGSTTDIQRIKEEDQRKSDFIGMVSHELKTPLTSLTAIVQMAQQKLKKSEDSFLAGAMEKATVQVKKMAKLINGFLNISRLESGKIQIEKHPFIMGDLIRESIEEINLTGISHRLVLHTCEKVVINADRDKIGSVISNLLSNAVKYSPKDTQVTVNCQIAGQSVRVSVSDEGIGIKSKDRDRLFERYYRVQDNAMRHVAGFGIGLYLSAEIVERHDGEIGVNSEPGKGSTFFFSLPLKA